VLRRDVLKYWMWQLNNEISLIKYFVNEIVSVQYPPKAILLLQVRLPGLEGSSEVIL
jgi:hypothetical protein